MLSLEGTCQAVSTPLLEQSKVSDTQEKLTDQQMRKRVSRFCPQPGNHVRHGGGSQVHAGSHQEEAQ